MCASVTVHALHIHFTAQCYDLLQGLHVLVSYKHSVCLLPQADLWRPRAVSAARIECDQLPC
jgi:hypothetical protein